MKIQREKLFQFVWEQPLSKLAPKLGISDRGLAKVCERYNIPVPPAGHWWKPLPQNARMLSRIRPSTAIPYHATIMAMVEQGEPARTIREAIRPLGYPGSLSALAQYIRRCLGTKTRFVKSSNQYAQFIAAVTSTPPSYEAKRPTLPDGPRFCYIGERHREDATEVPAIEGSTLFESIRPELAYAKEKDPELHLAFWLEVGTDLPAFAFSQLDWSMVKVTRSGWEIVGPKTQHGRILRSKVAPSAVLALQDERKTSGRVLTAPHRSRARLSMILGPEWIRHARALREELQTRQGPTKTAE